MWTIGTLMGFIVRPSGAISKPLLFSADRRCQEVRQLLREGPSGVVCPLPLQLPHCDPGLTLCCEPKRHCSCKTIFVVRRFSGCEACANWAACPMIPSHPYLPCKAPLAHPADKNVGRNLYWQSSALEMSLNVPEMGALFMIYHFEIKYKKLLGKTPFIPSTSHQNARSIDV